MDDVTMTTSIFYIKSVVVDRLQQDFSNRNSLIIVLAVFSILYTTSVTMDTKQSNSRCSCLPKNVIGVLGVTERQA